MLRRAFAALDPGGWVVIREAFEQPGRGHRLTVWCEQWAVRLGQNKTAHGLHFESLAGYQALLAEAGFVAATLKEAGLGSNWLIVARKPSGAGPAIHARAGEDGVGPGAPVPGVT